MSLLKETVARSVNYEITIADIARRSERRAWWVAFGASTMSLILAGGYFYFLPLKEKVPYLVMADAYTGTSTIARLQGDFSKNSITASEAINRSNVAHFILARESVMDEFWKILDGKGGLKEFAKNKQKTIRKQNGLGIFATQSPEDALASDIAAALIEQTATTILLPNPNASREDYIGGLKLTEAEYDVVVKLDERSRCFLVKQGRASSICQLNLRGMDDALAVISASTDNISIMHQVLDEQARQFGVTPDQLCPEQWLDEFYVRRKGSGKDGSKQPAGQRRAIAV